MSLGKRVFLYVMAALIMGGALGLFVEEIIKASYKSHLEQVLDEIYLEGNTSIGAIVIDQESKQELHRTGDYYVGDLLSYIKGETDAEPLPSTGHLIKLDGDYSYDLTNVLLKLATDRTYSQWTTKPDFEMTCLSKRDKVYEFTDIIIVASCFHQLSSEQVETKRYELTFFNKPTTYEHTYLIDNRVYNVFVNYLIEDMFKGTPFQVISPSLDRNAYSFLQEIRAKSIAKPGELYWGNKYCCLYPIESPKDGLVSRTVGKVFFLEPNSALSPMIYHADTTIQYRIEYKKEACEKLSWLCLGCTEAVCILIAVFLLFFMRKKDETFQ